MWTVEIRWPVWGLVYKRSLISPVISSMFSTKADSLSPTLISVFEYDPRSVLSEKIQYCVGFSNETWIKPLNERLGINHKMPPLDIPVTQISCWVVGVCMLLR